jgi:arylamine N-acetyltransferase
MYPALTESVEPSQQQQQQPQSNDADNSNWYQQSSCVSCFRHALLVFESQIGVRFSFALEIEQRRLSIRCWMNGATTTTSDTLCDSRSEFHANID